MPLNSLKRTVICSLRESTGRLVQDTPGHDYLLIRSHTGDHYQEIFHLFRTLVNVEMSVLLSNRKGNSSQRDILLLEDIYQDLLQCLN